jgi:arylformamidase
LQRVAAAVETAAAETRVVLLSRHGVLAWGASVQEAYDVRVIDISVSNRPGMHVYPGDPPLVVEAVRRTARGDVCNLSRLSMGSHTGTHVDAPYHFLAAGPPLGGVPLDRMVGEAVVADLRGRAVLDASALRDVPAGDGDILLCRTDNSALWAAPEFQRDFVHLTEDAAVDLVERGVRAFGLDYLSIERFGSTAFPVHHRLLGAGVFVIEGLDLSDVEPGRYTLVCLPLKFPDLDGAPARAVLLA